MILLSCATAMDVLRVMSRVSAQFTTEQGILAFCQCSQVCWLTLRDRVVVLRLLRRADVKHATHLVPESLLSVDAQMHLAVVNSRFYSCALMRWRTQTLEGRDLAQLKAVYAEFLDIDILSQNDRCKACTQMVTNFLDRSDKRLFLRSRVCWSCRVALRRNLSYAERSRQCPMWPGHLWNLGRDWVRLCQVRRCIRFQDPVSYSVAAGVARHEIRLEDPDLPAGFA